MIFSELYSAYYNAVAKIIKIAIDHPVEKIELRKIVKELAFGESILNIELALNEGRWQVLKPDGTTNIRNIPSMPLTTLQKRWLKAISLDPRIRLFTDDLPDYPDVEPLFTPDDYTVFDKYSDGDDYENEEYKKTFRLLMDAVRNSYPVIIDMDNRRGNRIIRTVTPKYIEYSEKDDKFRLIVAGRYGGIFNIGRIRKCTLVAPKVENLNEQQPAPIVEDLIEQQAQKCSVTFDLYDRRKALERVLLHFAHFEKEVEKTDDGQYRVTIRYDRNDETEMVIRILSFGPMIKVTEPVNFVKLIKERLMNQMSCGL